MPSRPRRPRRSAIVRYFHVISSWHALMLLPPTARLARSIVTSLARISRTRSAPELLGHPAPLPSYANFEHKARGDQTTPWRLSLTTSAEALAFSKFRSASSAKSASSTDQIRNCSIIVRSIEVFVNSRQLRARFRNSCGPSIASSQKIIIAARRNLHLQTFACVQFSCQRPLSLASSLQNRQEHRQIHAPVTNLLLCPRRAMNVE